MARKKKSLKGSQESVEDTLPEVMDSSASTMHANKSKDDSTGLHASDSEIFDAKKGRQLQKNKSNLFLIKSYSFIDKSNARRPKVLNVKEKLQDFENYHSSLRRETTLEDKENLKKQNENKEKPCKKEKHKKLKKSKSTYDSTEDLEEFRATLTKPSIIVEGEVSVSSKRPLTFHSETPHRPVVKSKTMEDIDTAPLIKRDSFIRHSLQSIRRSFSYSKKSSASSSSKSEGTASSSSASSPFVSSSSSSCSTSSSDTSNSLKKSKSKKKDLNGYKIKETKELLQVDNIKAAVDNSESSQQSDKMDGNSLSHCGEHINAITTSHPPIDLAKSASSSSCSSSTSSGSLSSAAAMSSSSASAASAGLSVLKEEDEKDLQISTERSTSSVSTLAQFPPDSLAPMAPLQTHNEAHSLEYLNTITGDRDNCPTTTNTSSTASTTTTSVNFTTKSSSSSPPQPSKTSKRNALQHQQSIAESIEASSIGCATSSEYSSARSLKHSSSSLAPLQSVPSTASLRSISPSGPNSTSSSTAKHEQSSAAASAASAAAAAGATTSTGSSTNATTPPEKEKKRKEVSSSRVKKFHRHFSQVSKDEKLINYFSCALVSDILLQGHLYITDQHFAFYSNVFGYVTKVVIPTSSVTKISKEKTAKIIPNAVGVATAEERHVFGSFISREAAFRLMVSVCSPLAPVEILVKDPAAADIPEEYSIEDDSSCSISGNESPAQATENGNSSNENHHSDTQLLRRSNLNISDEKHRHSDIPLNAKTATNAASLHLRTSAPPATALHYGNGNSSVIAGGGGGIAHIISKISSSPATAIGCATIEGNLTFIAASNASTTTSATTTPTPSTTSSPTTTVMALPHAKAYQFMNKFKTLSNKLMINLKFPTEVHVVYLGVMLSVLLAVFTVFLLYRILDIEAKTSVYRSPVEFNWHSGNDDDIFAEALRFQKQLQLKSTEEAQNILKTNLEQIAKVRRSLETLSMLIHDRSSSFSSSSSSPQTDDSD